MGTKKAPEGIVLTVFLPDLHVPFENKRALQVVLQFIKEVQPVRIVNLGDLVDFGPVSRFVQDPREKVDLQTQIERAGEILDLEREAAGKEAAIVYLEGNHETRLGKHLMRNDPELVWLKRDDVDIVSVPFLMELKRRRVRWVRADETFMLHNVAICHGDISSQYSAYTAKRMLDRARCDVIMGHTHRSGLYCYTGWEQSFEALECGSLIDRDSPAASYAVRPNWQEGFAVGQYDARNKLFQIQPIRFKHGMFIWGNRTFGA